jgi:tetratricopeptide (TPR) repeat protein
MRFQSIYLTVAVVITTPVYADDLLQQAEALLNQKQNIQAYDLLVPLEDQRAGDPNYDYLLGLAFLGAGEPTRAAFAFERCLDVEPNNGPCRVQMARTHIILGETPNARNELQTIKDYNPPPEVENLVSQYLGVITNVEKQQQRHINAFAQLGLGYDSNINSATEHSKIALPSSAGSQVFLTVPVSEDSGFLQLQAGSGIQYKFTPTVTGLADVNVQQHSVLDNHAYDYTTFDTSGGGLLDLNNNMQLQGKLQLQKMWLDGKTYRNVMGLLAQGQRPINENGQLAVFTQVSQMRYDTQTARDARRFNFGLAYSQAIETKYTPSFYTSVYRGQETAKDSAYDYFSQSFLGFRLGGSLIYSETISANCHLGTETRNYDALNPYLPFSNKRKDTETNLNLGLTWRIKPQLSLQPNYTYSRNSSNLPINDYTRHTVSVDLRFDM